MPATMTISTNEEKDQDTYRGVSRVKSVNTIPEYRGGITWTLQVVPRPMPTPVSQITVNPDVRGGVPCVGEGHWPIYQILEKLIAGVDIEQLMQDYPGLTPVDAYLALKAAAWVMRDPAIDWLELNLPGMVDFQAEMQSWQNMSYGTLSQIENLSRD